MAVDATSHMNVTHERTMMRPSSPEARQRRRWLGRAEVAGSAVGRGEGVMRVLMSAPGGLGHVNPLVSLAIAFRDRGNDVVVACAEPAYERVWGLGIRTADV